MENVVAYLKDHWQYVVIAGGGLTLLGAILTGGGSQARMEKDQTAPDALSMTYSDRAGIVSLWAFWAL